MNRVGIFGDWHSDTAYATRLLNRIGNIEVETPDVFVHLGDFNFFDDAQGGRFLNTINESLKKLDKDMYVIDGNHEDFKYISTFPVNEEGFGEVCSNIFYIPRGHGWSWGGKKFVGVGGAHSVDYEYRTLNRDWFLEENITDEDVENALLNGSVDYLFTHDTPTNIPLPFNSNSAYTNSVISENKRKLIEITENLTPHRIFHGHHHRFYPDKFRKTTEVLGLDMNGKMFGDNYVVLNVLTGDLEYQFHRQKSSLQLP